MNVPESSDRRERVAKALLNPDLVSVEDQVDAVMGALRELGDADDARHNWDRAASDAPLRCSRCGAYFRDDNVGDHCPASEREAEHLAQFVQSFRDEILQFGPNAVLVHPEDLPPDYRRGMKLRELGDGRSQAEPSDTWWVGRFRIDAESWSPWQLIHPDAVHLFGEASVEWNLVEVAAIDRAPVSLTGFLADVQREVESARAKFPGNGYMYLALAEEVGEVAKALLERDDGLYAECVQVAAMAMRLAEEGDSDSPNAPVRSLGREHRMSDDRISVEVILTGPREAVDQLVSFLKDETAMWKDTELTVVRDGPSTPDEKSKLDPWLTGVGCEPEEPINFDHAVKAMGSAAASPPTRNAFEAVRLGERARIVDLIRAEADEHGSSYTGGALRSMADKLERDGS